MFLDRRKVGLLQNPDHRGYRLLPVAFCSRDHGLSDAATEQSLRGDVEELGLRVKVVHQSAVPLTLAFTAAVVSGLIGESDGEISMPKSVEAAFKANVPAPSPAKKAKVTPAKSAAAGPSKQKAVLHRENIKTVM